MQCANSTLSLVSLCLCLSVSVSVCLSLHRSDSVTVSLPLHRLSGASSASFRPLSPVNLTVYHVAEANYTTLDDKNTGDPAGDAEFMIRAAGLPFLCSNLSGEANITYDCGDVEQTGDDLVVSQVVIEASSAFGEYAECNVNQSTGAYYCECENRTAPRPPHHYPALVPCPNNVGKIMVVNESGWAHEVPNSTDPLAPIWERSAYRYYFYNAAQKLGGTWYSTLRQGDCAVAQSQDNCTWRHVETVKRVSKKCQLDKLFSVVEVEGQDCFQTCSGTGAQRNTTTGCWTSCFYDTVFGESSNRTAYPVGSSAGMNQTVLVEAWLAAFKDVADGGCPAYTPNSTRRAVPR